MRKPALRLALLAGCLGSGLGCSNEVEALVHVTFDKDLRYLGASFSSGPGVASIYLTPGIHVLRFERRGKRFGCILDVSKNGGEVYLGIESKDLAPIIVAEEGG